jgi:murein DD-endopeptidase MepM/ murein hydrolase activator NlpD
VKLKKRCAIAAVVLLVCSVLFTACRRDSVPVSEEETSAAVDSEDPAESIAVIPVFDDSSFVHITENDFSIAWSGETAPGDPLFVALMGKDTAFSNAVEGSTVSLFSGEKRIAKASFFPAGENLYSAGIYSAALPLSTWLTPGSYLLKITLGGDDGVSVFEYEVHLSPKEFISETIALDSSNTAIRTDTSDEKMRQIERLNEVLFSVTTEGVWNTGNHRLPVTSTRRTSFFGDRRVFAYSNGTSANSLHYGIDFGVPTGTPIYASAQGRVRIAEFRISTGWTVVLEHFPGLYGLYYHMDSLAVEEGQMVSSGDLLGESGSTGLATGPHLHWEVRLNGEAVNPDFLVENPIVPVIKGMS